MYVRRGRGGKAFVLGVLSVAVGRTGWDGIAWAGRYLVGLGIYWVFYHVKLSFLYCS